MSNLDKRMNKFCMGSCISYYRPSKVGLIYKKITTVSLMTISLYVTTYSVKRLKHNISTLYEVKTCLFYKETVYPLSIFSNIKFEHRISLNYNVKKCHDLGHLSFSVNRPIKLI
jgi:hypothetical protein